MKYLWIFVTLFCLSCHTKQEDYSLVILDKGVVNTSFANQIDEPGRMLLGWYLYAYGNECTGSSEKPKCQLLNLLGIDNECDTSYIQSLKQWFAGDVYRSIKLRSCPTLPQKGAIQNEFKYIALERKKDHLTISFQVDGMNNSQEKSWNMKKKESFWVGDGRLEFLE